MEYDDMVEDLNEIWYDMMDSDGRSHWNIIEHDYTTWSKNSLKYSNKYQQMKKRVIHIFQYVVTITNNSFICAVWKSVITYTMWS